MKTIRLEFQSPGATGYQLELLLRQYGIPVSGRWAKGTQVAMDIPAAQEKWARYILRQAGVLRDGDEASADAAYGPRPLPTAWGVGVKRRGLMTMWVDFLGGILGAPGLIAPWQAKTKRSKP